MWLLYCLDVYSTVCDAFLFALDLAGTLVASRPRRCDGVPGLCPDGVSQLDYISTAEWPFGLKSSGSLRQFYISYRLIGPSFTASGRQFGRTERTGMTRNSSKVLNKAWNKVHCQLLTVTVSRSLEARGPSLHCHSSQSDGRRRTISGC